MKSKAHTKNYAASGSGSSTQQSGTQSSESDTEDSGMDSSGKLEEDLNIIRIFENIKG